MKRAAESPLRAIALAAAALFGTAAAAPQAPAPPHPRHIMSVNLCTDLMLLMLVPRSRIASITFLARPAVAALMPGADRGVATNHGAAEEVLRQRPDLILAGPWSAPVLRRLAARAGARIVEIPSADGFPAIRTALRQAGAAVGEPARADALIAAMDRDLADLAATAPRRRLRVVAWGGAGSVPGRGTLTDAIVTAAGADNIAAHGPPGRYASFGLEEMLAARPDAVLQGHNGYDAPSLDRSEAAHPLLRAAYRNRRITFPDAAYGCGLPQSARAAGDLRAALARVPDGPVAW